MWDSECPPALLSSSINWRGARVVISVLQCLRVPCCFAVRWQVGQMARNRAASTRHWRTNPPPPPPGVLTTPPVTNDPDQQALVTQTTRHGTSVVLHVALPAFLEPSPPLGLCWKSPPPPRLIQARHLFRPNRFPSDHQPL